MRTIIYFISVFLFILSCEKETDNITITDKITTDLYYKNEIFNDNNLKLYGRWKYIYSFGGFGGLYFYPEFDYYLEIVQYGIYGVIRNNEIIEIGKIEIVLQEEDKIVINFVKDDEYSINFLEGNKLAIFNGNNTLMLGEYNFDDGFTAYFKRIK